LVLPATLNLLARDVRAPLAKLVGIEFRTCDGCDAAHGESCLSDMRVSECRNYIGNMAAGIFAEDNEDTRIKVDRDLAPHLNHLAVLAE
jgi:hypothetical protein